MLLVDDVEQFIAAFRAAEDAGSIQRKVSLLLELDRHRGPRSLQFLLDELRDRTEAIAVRVACIRRLRNADLTAADNRFRVAEALVDVLWPAEHDDLRLEAVLTLGDFADIPSVQTALGTLALRLSESIDLRYTAFTSLERSGPSPLTIQLFRQLEADETLGPPAESVLRLWRVA